MLCEARDRKCARDRSQRDHELVVGEIEVHAVDALDRQRAPRRVGPEHLSDHQICPLEL
jgi:hypothetical protein